MKSYRIALYSTVTAFFAGVCVNSLIDEAFNRNAEKEISALHVKIVPRPSLILDDEDPEFTKIVNSLKDGDFYPLEHACGNGFSTGFITVGRKKLSYSFTAFEDETKGKEAFREIVGDAKVIIEQNTLITHKTRTIHRVFQKHENVFGENYFVVLWRGPHDHGYFMVVGDDEAATLKLEKYVKRKD